MKGKKISFTNLFLIMILLTGIGIFAYPTFSNWWNSFHQSRAIAVYKEEVAGMKESQIIRMWRQARQYNAKLRRKPDRFHLTGQEKREYSRLLDAGGTGIMGYIDIPRIRVSLPVYHGTKEEILQIAVGHIEGSSLPVGGPGSHVVLSGHRGLPSAKLFSDIDRLEIGDRFNLHVLDKALSYEVDRISTVLPGELKELEIRKGKDYVTLVTCTPYGVNTHRLLVRGHRISVKKTEVSEKAHGTLLRIAIIIILILGGGLILLILFEAGKGRKKRKGSGKSRTFLFLLPLCLLSMSSIPLILPGRQLNVYADCLDNSKENLSLKVQLAVEDEDLLKEIDRAGVAMDIYKLADICSVSDGVFRLISRDEYGYGELFTGKEAPDPPDRGCFELSARKMRGREWRNFSQKAAWISLGLSGKGEMIPTVTGAKPGEEVTGITPGLYLLVARGTKEPGIKKQIRYIKDKEIVTIIRSENHEFSFEPDLFLLVPEIPVKTAFSGIAMDRGEGARIWMKLSLKPIPDTNPPGPGKEGDNPAGKEGDNPTEKEEDSQTGTYEKTQGPSPGYSAIYFPGDKSNGDKGIGALVKTGDDHPITLYCILAVFSGVLFLFSGVMLKKEKTKTKQKGGR